MISIVIPCYEMAGRGIEMLRELIASIQMQTFTDYEIVISNSSPELDHLINLPWHVGREGAAANLNNAIDHARGDIIKPMFQDDKFMEPDTLQKIADAFTASVNWIACTSHNEGEGYRTYDHVPYPHRNLEELRKGENTYGGPSAMAWRKNDLRFDENLKWLFDCEFYARMTTRYGVPMFVDTPIFVRQWDGQATHTIADGHTRVMETNYVVEKYRNV